jgi:hypothetical protein
MSTVSDNPETNFEVVRVGVGIVRLASAYHMLTQACRLGNANDRCDNHKLARSSTFRKNGHSLIPQ